MNLSVDPDEWIEIFSGSKQVDSSGKEHDGDALIETAVSSFDPSYHEPPVVLGHPEHDSPSYGWVEALKVKVVDSTKKLMAKFKQLNPGFVQMFRDGRYKKRSASFYPDGRLRHVGFLGAMPPAVKGLEDASFFESDGPGIAFEKKYTKEEIDQAAKEAYEQERKKGLQEATLAHFQEKRRLDIEQIQNYCETGLKGGITKEKWIEMGIVQFMTYLSDEPGTIQFSERGDPQTRLDWFKDFLLLIHKLLPQKKGN